MKIIIREDLCKVLLNVVKKPITDWHGWENERYMVASLMECVVKYHKMRVIQIANFVPFSKNIQSLDMNNLL